MNQATKQVVIVGAGFAGLNAAKRLRDVPGIAVTLLDRENHHLFQPLLYQVAMAALSPADIAVPIRSLFARARNVRVLKAQVQSVAVDNHTVVTDSGEFKYDYLLLASGSQHAYFGHEEWEIYAPGLKTLPQATEIRRRVLEAFEAAERDQTIDTRRRHLTFVVVGGGPTGVELAGAIGEMSRYTLARDFRSIDPRQTRVILVEAGPRILPSFDGKLAARAMRDLESLGVQVWTNSRVTNVTPDGVSVGNEHVHASTVLWAAGVRASDVGGTLGAQLDSVGRVKVGPDLTIPGHPEVFVLGDMARLEEREGQPLPGVAFVAMQEGIYAANLVKQEVQRGAITERAPFRYHDLGQLATIGRSRAIAEFGRLRLAGYFAWWFWLLVHIYRLSGFRNRLSVLVQWAWSYMTFGRGARLIVDKDWQAYPERPPGH
jgi:NADH dehydrogenase